MCQQFSLTQIGPVRSHCNPHQPDEETEPGKNSGNLLKSDSWSRAKLGFDNDLEKNAFLGIVLQLWLFRKKQHISLVLKKIKSEMNSLGVRSP